MYLCCSKDIYLSFIYYKQNEKVEQIIYGNGSRCFYDRLRTETE
jgi:hypothetical protein